MMKSEKSRTRSGQSVVEFALVLPILLLVVLGIVEFGILILHHLNIANGAREGARAAALGRNGTQITEWVQQGASVTTGLTIVWQSSGNGTSWVTHPMNGTNTVPAGDFVRITVNRPHQQLTHFIPGLDNVIITKTVTMRREP
jgi:Flp pilus assembly protein TadG